MYVVAADVAAAVVTVAAGRSPKHPPVAALETFDQPIATIALPNDGPQQRCITSWARHRFGKRLD